MKKNAEEVVASKRNAGSRTINIPMSIVQFCCLLKRRWMLGERPKFSWNKSKPHLLIDVKSCRNCILKDDFGKMK